jgi:hypothetical protein
MKSDRGHIRGELPEEVTIFEWEEESPGPA